tara:strand:- start:10 stop:657 length:648 start_codon:yes stop_codon:yes gene_type:complete
MKSLKYYIYRVLTKIVINLVYRTSTISVSGEEHILPYLNNKKPFLLCVWHGQMLFPIFYFKKKKRGIWAIASQHQDAQIMASFLKSWSHKIIEGSSTRGGSQVIASMKQAFENKEPVAVTIDGPKGPALVCKPGSLMTAKSCEVDIICASGVSTSYWTARSWDRFTFPKPFSKIIVGFSSPISFDELSDKPEESVRLVSDRLNRLSDATHRKDKR